MKSKLMVLLILLLAIACEQVDIAKRIDIFMNAKIGEGEFSTEDGFFTFTFGNILRIEAATPDSLWIIMELDSADQVGIYDFSNTAKYEAFYVDSLKNSFSTKLTGLGTLEITRLTQTTVEGTFEFTARNLTLGNRIVSEGEFSLARKE